MSKSKTSLTPAPQGYGNWLDLTIVQQAVGLFPRGHDFVPQLDAIEEIERERNDHE